MQNLNKVCFLELFLFLDPAIVGHPVNLSYNSIPEELGKLAPFKRLIDLFIGAESRFFPQTNQFPIIDHVLYSVLIGIF